MMIHLDPSPRSLYEEMVNRLADELDPEGAINDDYEKFKKKYWNDLAGFAQDCLIWDMGKELAAYQISGMKKLVETRRFSLRGPHGLGKTAFAAIAVLWFSLTRDGKDWKIPTLASSWRQVEKYLWPEIHKWAKRIRWDRVGREPFNENRELITLNLKLTTGFAFAMASNDEALIEGAHADHILYLFDESKSIPDATWDAAEGAMSVGDCMWLAVSTPGEPVGRFYQIQSKKTGYEDWFAFHVTLEMSIQAGRIDQDWASQRKRQWGEKSAVYQNRVLGNFASSDEDAVIPLSWVEESNERWLQRNERNISDADWGIHAVIGADVGRGGDPSVIAHRWDHPSKNRAIRNLDRFHEHDIMPLAGRIAGILRGDVFVKAVIDIIGIGAGAYDRLREQSDIKGRVLPFVANGKTSELDESEELGFVDLRSLGYWRMREGLGDGSIDLPPDDLLTGDLTTPKYKVMSGGKIKVESKKDLKERLGRSTDDGDAVIMAFMDQYVNVEMGTWQIKYA